MTAPTRVAGSVSAAVGYSAVGGTVQPVYGAGYIPQAKDTLVWVTGEQMGGDTLGAQTNWNQRPSTNSQQMAVYLRTSQGPINGAIDPRDLPPAVQWGTGKISWAFCFAVRGALEDVTQVIDVWTDKGGFQLGNIVGTNINLTPSFDGEYVLFVGQRNHSATQNGVTFTKATGFDSILIQAPGPNGTGPAVAACDWSQTTATTIPTNTLMAASTPDGTTQSMEGIVLVFKPYSLDASAVAQSAAAAAMTTAIRASANAFASAAAVGALTNWATVTLAGTLYTGTGGVLDPNFWLDVQPGVGTTLFYDSTNITIYPNGEISSTTNNCSAVVMFFDGVAWSVGLIVLTPQLVTYAHVLSAAAGALTTAIQLAGAAVSATADSGALSTGIQLAGAALAVAAAASALTTGVQLNAAAIATVTAHGALTGGVASLQGNAVASSQVLAPLTTRIQMAGQVLVNSQATGALSAQVVLNGSAVALTQAAADLSTAIQLAGNANVVTTAAGAALITSALAAAANAVTSANGALLTGLLIAGNALVTSVATGDLSTGIQLAGAAVVDTEAALKPIGPEGQFGYAVINILSRTGFPVALSTFIEDSACIVSISYFNAQGLPFTPSAVSYRVDDQFSGKNLVPLSVVGPTASSNAITITGAQNELVSLTRASEEHQILFEIVDGVGNVNFASQTFDIVRSLGVN